MKELLEKITTGKKILILGFGREGRSSYRLLKKLFPDIEIRIADKNPNLHLSEFEDIKPETLYLGGHYLEAAPWADVIFKSPGIDFGLSENGSFRHKIVSQTSLFLEQFHSQIIGITGTKGKSTTSSLIYHLLKESGRDALLVGNIGVPPFDLVEKVKVNTIIVFEISAHQLEYVAYSPHIAVLLNIFQEHLDYFPSLEKYAEAKFNITRYQSASDFLIFDTGNQYLREHLLSREFTGKLIPVELDGSGYHADCQAISIAGAENVINVTRSKLNGRHNLKNILIAATACKIAGLNTMEIESGLTTFNPLEHRLEEAGTAAGIRFINDSISTIPESTIEAIKTLPETDTIIIGGFDRGIEYRELVDYLVQSSVRNFLFTGAAGKRMMELMLSKNPAGKNLIFVEKYHEMPELILRHTRSGKICLLSPAASSYDQFVNFEERGKIFKEMVERIKNKRDDR